MNAIISTGKSILNALAFANVNDIDALRAMLGRIEAPAATLGEVTQPASGQSCYSPAIKHVQGAL